MAIPPPPHMSRHRKGKKATPETNKGLIADVHGAVVLPADVKAQSRPLVPPPPDENATVSVGVAGQRGIPVSEASQGGAGSESSYRKAAEARANAVAEAKAKAAADAKAATEAKTKATTEAKTKATAEAALAEAMQLKAAADAALAQAQAIAAAANAKLNE